MRRPHVVPLRHVRVCAPPARMHACSSPEGKQARQVRIPARGMICVTPGGGVARSSAGPPGWGGVSEAALLVHGLHACTDCHEARAGAPFLGLPPSAARTDWHAYILSIPK